MILIIPPLLCLATLSTVAALIVSLVKCSRGKGKKRSIALSLILAVFVIGITIWYYAPYELDIPDDAYYSADSGIGNICDVATREQLTKILDGAIVRRDPNGIEGHLTSEMRGRIQDFIFLTVYGGEPGTPGAKRLGSFTIITRAVIDTAQGEEHFDTSYIREGTTVRTPHYVKNGEDIARQLAALLKPKITQPRYDPI